MTDDEKLAALEAALEEVEIEPSYSDSGCNGPSFIAGQLLRELKRAGYDIVPIIHSADTQAEIKACDHVVRFRR